jgi:hypothetical protein
MTNQQIINWLKTNIGADVQRAIADTNEQLFTPEIMIGMAMRETGLKVMELLNEGHTVPEIYSLIKGDYSKRLTDKEPIYHGYGLWQIDIGSFPEFVKSGDWIEPYQCCLKALTILNANKHYLLTRFPGLAENSDSFLMEIIASYNTGAGSESKAIAAGSDVDSRTFNQDYSNSVLDFAAMV